ncbi:MAG TPA: hypothetical protein VIY48_10295 [Candidatus Paceibacterota bacterium]
MEQVLNIALCMSLCFFAWGFFYIGLHRNGIGYVRHFWITTIYFLTAGSLTGLIFHEQTLRALQHPTRQPLVLLAVFMLVQVAVSLLVPRYVPEPRAYFAQYPDRYFLQINWRRSIAKSADIASQQVFIVLLITFLHDAGLPLVQTIAGFLILFSLLHIPLIANEWGRWPAWVFIGAVVVFSLLFPPLILYVPYGFVYTFMIHWMFYTVMAVSFWVFHPRFKQLQA